MDTQDNQSCYIRMLCCVVHVADPREVQQTIERCLRSVSLCGCCVYCCICVHVWWHKTTSLVIYGCCVAFCCVDVVFIVAYVFITVDTQDNQSRYIQMLCCVVHVADPSKVQQTQVRCLCPTLVCGCCVYCCICVHDWRHKTTSLVIYGCCVVLFL